MNIMVQSYLAAVEKYPLTMGAFATGTNGTAVGISAWVASAIPYLQVISLSIGILIGLLTLYGLVRKRYKRWKEER